MGLIAMGDFEERIERRGYVTMLEPCIGGGANIIGAVNAMFQHGYNPCKQLLVTGYDLDARCVHMSYIQLSLMGVPAMIQQRNSLSLETYGDYWVTPVFILNGWAGRLHLEQLIEFVKNFFNGDTEITPAEPPAKVETAKKQLTLF